MISTQFATKWLRSAQLGLALIVFGGPVCALAQSAFPAHYTVVDLGPVGPSSSEGQPFKITGNGLVSGERVVANPKNSLEWVSQAVLWDKTDLKVIGTPGLGGPNSVAFSVNYWGQAVGQADTETRDPNGEDFCGSTVLGLTHSGNTCVPYQWQNGTMVELPRLKNSAGKEGNNGVALQNNFFGMIAGTAENAERDSTCPGALVSPQSIQFKPVIWIKRYPLSQAELYELPTVDRDPDGIAYAINDLGQAVGATGKCGPFNTVEQNNLTPLHAVLWQGGNAINLGNLGGDGLFAGIYATGLNDFGQVVGTSDTTGDKSFHAFLWQKGHIKDLGTLKGDSYSSAIAIANNGMVLGVSVDADFSLRAVLWRDEIPTDLNTLVPSSTPLYLQAACSINYKGEIIGFGVLKSDPTKSPAYLAIPVLDSDGKN
jgi:probable HAF family extracellular repeat protein